MFIFFPNDALFALFPFIFSIVKVDSCPGAHVAWLGEDASQGCAGAMEMVQGHGLGLGLEVLEVNGWT